MRLIILACALLSVSQLVGCDSSSKESQLATKDQSSKAQPDNQDLLSTDGELFPLSSYYSVCAKRPGVLRATFRNGPLSPQHPTVAKLTGGVGELTITIGKFDLKSDTALKDIPAASTPRRIRMGSRNGQSFILVSDFDEASQNLVKIDYEDVGASAQAEALRFANTVAACHVSSVPTKANDGD